MFANTVSVLSAILFSLVLVAKVDALFCAEGTALYCCDTARSDGMGLDCAHGALSAEAVCSREKICCSSVDSNGVGSGCKDPTFE
ncbi:unnamed protein product [Mortierella alpina]